MIPVTTFAGKKVAVFGLGSSGLLSARALAAGGAEVIAFDDDGKKLAEAQAAGFKTQDLHEIDWRTIAALVLAPGVPLTHPAPHWSVALARKAQVEVIGDIELFCRERAKSTRTRRIACAEIAKKWRRFFHCKPRKSASRKKASCTSAVACRVWSRRSRAI